MQDQSQDPARRPKLVSLFAQQRILVGTRLAPALAASLAGAAKAKDYPAGKQVYVEGDAVQEVIYFVLGGSVRVERAGKQVATLTRGQFFGEFPMLDPATGYLATMTAAEAACIAAVPWTHYERLANATPTLWRNMASELALRLRGAPATASNKPEESKSIRLRMFDAVWPRKRVWQAAAVVLALPVLGLYAFWTTLPEAAKTSWLVRSKVIDAVVPPASAASR